MTVSMRPTVLEDKDPDQVHLKQDSWYSTLLEDLSHSSSLSGKLLLISCLSVASLATSLNSPSQNLVHSSLPLSPSSPISILHPSLLRIAMFSNLSALSPLLSPSSLSWPLWSLYPPRLAPPLISVLSLLSSLYSLSSHLLLSSYFLTYLLPLFYLYILY